MRLVRLRPVLLCVIAAVLALGALSGCGGGSGDDGGPSSAQSADALLAQAFSDTKALKSATLDARLDLDLTGVANLQGPLSFEVHGPFVAQPGGGLPRFALDLKVEVQGQTLAAGMTSTGDAGYVTLLGDAYQLDPKVFAAFRKGFDTASGKRADQAAAKDGQAAIGFDPRRWLVDPKVAGHAELDGTDVDRVTAGVDVRKLLGGVEGGLSQATRSGTAGTGLPEPLSAAERKQLEDSVQSARVTLDLGHDDRRLRRLAGDVRLKGGSSTGGTIHFELRFSDLDQPQTIAAPANPKPYREFVTALQTLVGAAATGGATGAAGPASSTAGRQARAYFACLDAAKTQADKTACLRRLAAG